MAWVRIDDRVHDHPKFRRAWELEPASVGLELFAMSHCAAFMSDGCVERAFVSAQFRDRRRERRAVNALVESGLWTPNGMGGWQIHDWLDYNEPASEVLARRKAKEARRRLNRSRLDASR